MLAYVLFQTTARLTADDTDGFSDIFLRDRLNQTTMRISGPFAGNVSGGRGASANGSLSSDGSRIVFESNATDLAPVPTGSVPLFYFHDRAAGTNRAVASVNLGGGAASTKCSNPIISSDGAIVAVESTGFNLVTGLSAANGQIYAHNLNTDFTFLVTGGALAAVGKPATTPASVKLLGISQDGFFHLLQSAQPRHDSIHHQRLPPALFGERTNQRRGGDQRVQGGGKS